MAAAAGPSTHALHDDDDDDDRSRKVSTGTHDGSTDGEDGIGSVLAESRCCCCCRVFIVSSSALSLLTEPTPYQPQSFRAVYIAGDTV